MRNPEILSGMIVFTGTRVPLKNLTDYPESDSTIDEFVDDSPSVKLAQVITLLEESRELFTTAS